MSTTDPRQPASARPYTGHFRSRSSARLLESTGGRLWIAGVIRRLSSWLALICCVQSLANMKSAENDMKQVVMAATFAVMGMVTNYMTSSGEAASALKMM